MTDLPVRALRNDVSSVLRRVEAGERFRVTVSGRPVAELTPLSRKRRSMPWEELVESLRRVGADAGLAEDLRALVPDTTDDVAVP